MKKIAYKELPEGLYFWRKGSPVWWRKEGKTVVTSMESVINLPNGSVFLPPPPDDEIVLSDPSVCANCWQELPGFPPVYQCPNCGSTCEDRRSLDSIKRIIAEWSGNPDPHI